ncbi:unnamed protein product, partial [Vitis vinifera]
MAFYDSSRPRQKQRRPEEKRSRFAPELDGLHCFETIVRY